MGTNTEAGKAKILRNVAFPETLDIYDFCSENLKKSVDDVRKKEILEKEEEK